MKDLSKVFEAMSVKPKIWEHDLRILREEAGVPKTLQPYSQEEKFLIFKKKILVNLPKKNIQRKKNTTEKTILEKREDNEDEASVIWLVKDKEDKILGPYTSLEVNEMIQKDEFRGKYIKRDHDREFIEYDKVTGEVGDILNINEYEKYVDRIAATKNLSITDKSNCNHVQDKEGNEEYFIKLKDASNRFSLLFLDENKQLKEDRILNDTHKTHVVDRIEVRRTTVEIPSLAVSYPRTSDFFRSRNVRNTVESVVKKIYGKSRASAMNIICFLTSLSKEDCEKAINLIVSESSKDVLTDSNSDGFVKIFKKQNKK